MGGSLNVMTLQGLQLHSQIILIQRRLYRFIVTYVYTGKHAMFLCIGQQHNWHPFSTFSRRFSSVVTRRCTCWQLMFRIASFYIRGFIPSCLARTEKIPTASRMSCILWPLAIRIPRLRRKIKRTSKAHLHNCAALVKLDARVLIVEGQRFLTVWLSFINGVLMELSAETLSFYSVLKPNHNSPWRPWPWIFVRFHTSRNKRSGFKSCAFLQTSVIMIRSLSDSKYAQMGKFSRFGTKRSIAQNHGTKTVFNIQKTHTE